MRSVKLTTVPRITRKRALTLLALVLISLAVWAYLSICGACTG